MTGRSLHTIGSMGALVDTPRWVYPMNMGLQKVLSLRGISYVLPASAFLLCPSHKLSFGFAVVVHGLHIHF